MKIVQIFFFVTERYHINNDVFRVTKSIFKVTNKVILSHNKFNLNMSFKLLKVAEKNTKSQTF